jgi:hypothetical protein
MLEEKMLQQPKVLFNPDLIVGIYTARNLILSIFCIYVFCTIYTIYSDHFPIHRSPTGFSKGRKLFSVWDIIFVGIYIYIYCRLILTFKRLTYFKIRYRLHKRDSIRTVDINSVLTVSECQMHYMFRSYKTISSYW